MSAFRIRDRIVEDYFFFLGFGDSSVWRVFILVFTLLSGVTRFQLISFKCFNN